MREAGGGIRAVQSRRREGDQAGSPAPNIPHTPVSITEDGEVFRHGGRTTQICEDQTMTPKKSKPDLAWAREHIRFEGRPVFALAEEAAKKAAEETEKNRLAMQGREEEEA